MASAKLNQVPSRRARNSLSRDGILDAAEKIAKSGGDFSIRNVATKLSCSPMALYRYFPDKQALLLGLLDRLIGQIPLYEDTSDGRERLIKVAIQHLKVLQANAWAIPLLFQNPDPGPAVRRVGEVMLATIRAGGGSNEYAVKTFSAILALNYGWAGFTSDTSKRSSTNGMNAKFGRSPESSEELVVTSELWHLMKGVGSDQDYLEALTRLISPSR